jgi:hypothetical protein
MRAREFITEMDRRGFLKGLAGLAASAAVPAPVVKLLSTPAGVSSLSTPAGVSALGVDAGVALLKGILDHLNQWSGEDDDDYFEAWEDMAYTLGFNSTDEEGEYHDPLGDLMELYHKDPKQAAEQLIKHIQSKAVNPADVKASFQSRADNPDDWRYHGRKDPELTAAERARRDAEWEAEWEADAPARVANEVKMWVVEKGKNKPQLPEVEYDQREHPNFQKELAEFQELVNDSSWRNKPYEIKVTIGGKPVALPSNQKVAAGPGTLARAATVAKAGIDKLSNLKKPAQQVKATPALSAPTRPEVELPVNAKQKQAEPVKRQGDDQKQLAEFDPGEGGFGPFKVYYEQDYLIGQFPTYEEAKDEVDFLRQSDPKSATHHWRIVDGTGETVWEYNIGDDIDAWRRSQKFQRRS